MCPKKMEKSIIESQMFADEKDQILETSCRNAHWTICSTWISSTATIRKGSIAGIGRDAIRRLEKIA